MYLPNQACAWFHQIWLKVTWIHKQTPQQISSLSDSNIVLGQCVTIVLLSPNFQEIPGAGMSPLTRTYKERERQERLPLCDRLRRPYHCHSCSCDPLCLTSHPRWMTDRCLLLVHDFRQPFLRYFDQEALSPGHRCGQLTMPNLNTTLPSAVI